MSVEEPYSAAVRRRFSAPAHAGSVEGGVGARVDAQGLRIALSAREEGGRTVECRFLAWGCPHVVAACDYWCCAKEGRETSALAYFPRAEMMQELDIPLEKTGRILVLEDAARLLAERLGVTVEG
jgi:NifU-like protein involved in Fe-S cluster formation